MNKKIDFVFPGFAMFAISIVMLWSGAIFPEYAESLLVTAFGFLLFFGAFVFVTLKALGMIK